MSVKVRVREVNNLDQTLVAYYHKLDKMSIFSINIIDPSRGQWYYQA